MKTFVRDTPDVQKPDSQKTAPTNAATESGASHINPIQNHGAQRDASTVEVKGPARTTGAVLHSPMAVARLAGLFYLVLCATAFFGVYAHARVVKSNNATETADNIRKSTTLFRFGVVSDLMQATFFLFTVMALYVLLKHVNQFVAAAMVLIVTVSVAIQSLNMLFQYTAIVVATGKDYSQSFGKAGSEALALLFTNMQENGFFIAQIFFGLWLLPLGYLMIKSKYVPRLFGVALNIAGVSMIIEFFAHFLSPGFADNIKPFTGTLAAVGEIPFFLWLVIKGVRTGDSESRDSGSGPSSKQSRGWS
jgi:Domain of unknown function (DUF4386)